MELNPEQEARLREALGAERELVEVISVEPCETHRVTSTLWLERRLFHRVVDPPDGGDEQREQPREETETELSRDFVHFPSGTVSRMAMTGRWVPSAPPPAPFTAAESRLTVTTDDGHDLALSVAYVVEDHLTWSGPTPQDGDDVAAFAAASEVATYYGVHAVTLAELADSTPRRDAPAPRGEISPEVLATVRDRVKALPSPAWHTRVHATQTLVEGGDMLRVLCALGSGERRAVWLPR